MACKYYIKGVEVSEQRVKELLAESVAGNRDIESVLPTIIDKINNYAIQEQSTGSENAPIGEGGQNQPQNNQGVRQGEQGKEPAAEGGKKEVGAEFKPFADIVKKAKSIDEALEKIRQIDNVAPEIADAFSKKYNPDGKKSVKEAFTDFYNEVKGEKEVKAELPAKEKLIKKEEAKAKISKGTFVPHPNNERNVTSKNIKLKDGSKAVVVKTEFGKKRLTITVQKDGQEIGGVGLNVNEDGTYSASTTAGLHTKKGFRRNGVATAMYDYAEELGISIKPQEEEITNDGKAFWADRNKKEKLSAKEEAKAKIAKNIEGFLSGIGGIKNLTSEDRASLVENVRNILEGVAELSILELQEMFAPVWDKYGLSEKEGKKVLLEAMEEEPKVKLPKYATQEDNEDTTAERRLAERVLKSDKVPEETKKFFAEKGTKYAVRTMARNKAESKKIVSAFADIDELDTLENMVLKGEGIMPDVQVNLLKDIHSEYVKKSKEGTAKEQEYYRNKANELHYKTSEIATKYGQGVKAFEVWKEITGENPDLVLSDAFAQLRKRNQNDLDFHKEDLATVAATLKDLVQTKEGQEWLQTEVQAQTEAELKKYGEKRFGSERVAKIDKALSDFQKKIRSRTYDATLGVPAAILDASITVMRKALYAGAKLSEAVQAGIDYIKEKHKGNFNEDAFRADAMEGLADAEVPKAEKKEAKVKDAAERLKKRLADLDELIKDPDKAIAALEEKKTKIKPEKSDEIKAIENDIKIKKRLINMLANMETIPKAKQIEILGEATDIIAKNGYLSEEKFNNAVAKVLGLDHLTDADQKVITDMSSVIADYNKKVAEFDKNPNEATKKALRDAEFKAREANDKVSRLIKHKSGFWGGLSTYARAGLLGTKTAFLSFGSNFMQLTTLQNPINALSTGLDVVRFQLAKIDALHKLRPNSFDRKRHNSYIARAKGYWPNFLGGLSEAIKEASTGVVTDEIFERETRGGLHPLEAFNRVKNSLTGKQKQDFVNNVSDIMESTLGIPAETIFRVLNITDKPFRRGTQGAELGELVTLKLINRAIELEQKKGNLTEAEKKELEDINSGKAYERLTELPEEEDLKKAEEEGLRTVFQNKNIVSRFIESGEKGVSTYIEKKYLAPQKGLPPSKRRKIMVETIKGIATLGKSLTFPFVNMPLNWAQELFVIANPEISFFRWVNAERKGDIREANKQLSKATIGLVIGSTAAWLIVNGIVNGSGEGDDEDEKNFVREYQGGYNRLNLSLLNRKRHGSKSDKWEKNDVTFEYHQNGLLGGAISVYKNVYDKYGEDAFKGLDVTKNLLDESMKLLGRKSEKTFGVLQSVLNLPLVQSTQLALEALTSEGGNRVDKFLSTIAGVLLSPISPSLITKGVTAFQKEALLKDTQDPELSKWIYNNFKDRLGVGQDLPNRYSIWGEPITKTPKGANSYIYQLIDFTKGQTLASDTFGYELFYLLQDAKSKYPEVVNKILPTRPKDVVTIDGETHKLTPKQHAEFSMLVGQRRKQYAAALMNDPESWNNATVEEKADMLDEIYSNAYDNVKTELNDADFFDKP